MSTAYWFTGWLYRVAAGNIIALRILGVLIGVGCSIVLFRGVHALSRTFMLEPDARPRSELLSEACIVVLGGLLAYTLFLATPSYNLLNPWALTAACGCFASGLADLEEEDARGPARVAWMAAAGLCIAVSFFAKFPTAVSLLGLFGLALLSWPLGSARARALCLAAIGLGIGAMLLLYFLFAQSPGDLVRTFRSGASFVSVLGSNQRLGALARYCQEFGAGVVTPTVRGSWRLLAALAVPGLLLLAVRRRAASVALELVMCGVLVYAACKSALYQIGLDRSQYFFDLVRVDFGWLLLLSMTAIAWGVRSSWRSDGFAPHALRSAAILALVLFALPFLGAIGSANYIFLSMPYSLAPWFALFVLILRVMSGSRWRRLIGLVGAAALCVLCAAQISAGALGAPYRLNTGLAGQTEPTEIGSPPTSAFFRQLRAMAASNGFRPGDDVLAFLDMPGIVFALGGRSPGLPRYTSGYPGSEKVAEDALAAAGGGRITRAFLLQTSNSDEWLRGLRGLGIEFPGGYVLCGQWRIPYTWSNEQVRLWRPVTRK